MSKPTKGIKSQNDMMTWEKSEAYSDIMGMIVAVASAVKGKALSTPYKDSKATKGLADMLDELDKLVDRTPAEDQPQRFGNKAFRAWHDAMIKLVPESLKKVTADESTIVDLCAYLAESFGNPTRIDYGTGHELMFAAFLCYLFKSKVLSETDSVAVAFNVFNKYVILCRKLQQTYRMEPAGSQGVWSLDDYQFIPFIWGSSQLIGNTDVIPKSIPNPSVADSMASEYMFFACIQYIHKTKSGPFSEHSSTLYSIHGVPHWEKVFTGSIKMYKAEVLGKFPVVQHFLFCPVLSLKAVSPSASKADPKFD